MQKAREKIRSPLATGNYFSKYDKIVQDKLKSVGTSEVDRSKRAAEIQSQERSAIQLKSSNSSFNKPYSRRKIVLNRDKSPHAE